MSLFSGTRVIVAARVEKRVHDIVERLYIGAIEPPDAIRQLTELILKTAHAMTRAENRE